MGGYTARLPAPSDPSEPELIVTSLKKPSFLRTLSVLSTALLIAACGDNAESTAPKSPAPSGSESQAKTVIVTVAPANFTARVGDSTKYAAVVKDASGTTRSDVTPVWRAANTAVATVRTDGTVIAIGAGSTTITATALGKSSAVPITVTTATSPAPAPAPTPAPAPAPAPAPTPTPSGSEPTFTSGVHTALWMDDFENTANTAAIYSRYVTQGSENGLNLDATGGLSGSKALRMDWRTKTGCTDDSHFVEGIFPQAANEVVLQFSVRYQANFAFDWIGRGGACSGNAKKLAFLYAPVGDRFDFISENHVLGVGSDHDHPLFSQNQGGAALRPDDLADGAWHRITLRVKQSSTPTAQDGYIHGWVDGVQKWKVDNIASNAAGGWVLFKLPSTLNQGSPINQSEWFDNIRVWRP